jgi:hypothetical protein
MVKTFVAPSKDELNPKGKPTAEAPVAPPSTAYVIGAIASPSQNVWVLLPDVKLKL